MMKQLIAIMAVAITSVATAHPASVGIERETLGSGTPGQSGYEPAVPVLENNIYHAAQYLPGYPTAATIWPRVIEVPCTGSPHALRCEGYHWTPAMGRGEYLFFTPKIVAQPVVITKEVIVQSPPKIILKEVPVKRKKE
jgi:hypothetical protein